MIIGNIDQDLYCRKSGRDEFAIKLKKRGNVMFKLDSASNKIKDLGDPQTSSDNGSFRQHFMRF
jgi:hypothetical protein